MSRSSVMAADSVQIIVHALSAGSPTLVFAHATGFHGRVWTPLADELRAEFSCLAPDLRGHGDSTAPADANFDWGGFGADVLGVVDGLGLERPYGVGHSSGATALLLAEEARPGTFAALYCYEPIIVPADPPLGRDPDSWLAESTRRRRADFPSRADAVDHYAPRAPFSELDAEVLRAYVEFGFEDLPGGSIRLKCRPEHEALMYEMATAHDCFPHLDKIRCPVTLGRGGRSEAFTADRQAAVAARLARVQTQEHPDLGHLGPLEDPRAIAAGVKSALARGGSI